MAVTTDRAIARNQEWRVAKITEVNPATNHIAAQDQYGTNMLIDVTGQSPLLQVPVVGELWTVSRRGSDWILERRYENPDTKLPFTSMSPGEIRVEATGAINFYGTEFNFNDAPVGSGGGGGGAVASVFGRTGVVIALTGDYSVGQITGAAPLASPVFTGNPQGPTPATGDDSTSLATTHFVKAQGYITAASAPVTSVFTRTGAVVATTGDYSLGQITAGTNHTLAISGATTMASLAAGSAGQILRSGGASADPSWSSSTYPSSAGAAGHVPRSDGTNYVDAQLAATDLSNGTVGLGNIVLASGPAMTNPTANTQTAGDNSTKLATTAFVTAAVAGAGNYTIVQGSHGFTAGQLLYYTGSAFALAKADTAANAEVIGIVSSVIDVNTFTLQVSGRVTGLSGLTAGTTYFLSDTTAGALTATPPTTGNHISKPVGIATSTTVLYFYNWRGEVLTPYPVNPQVITSSFSGGPPSGPSDGDIWIASNVDSNGTRWQFQYNAGSASAYKWEFIGGPPVYSVVDTLESTSTLWGTTVDLTTVGPLYTIVRTGDYVYAASFRGFNNTAGDAAISEVVVTNAGTGIANDNNPITISGTTSTATQVGSSNGRLTVTVAGYDIRMRYSALVGGTASFQQRRMQIWPVRIL